MREEAVDVRVSKTAIGWFYAILSIAAGVFIIMTALSDLQLSIVDNGPARNFDLKQESNLAVWYPSVLLFCAGATALLVANSISNAIEERWPKRLWMLVALPFFALSADEASQYHERIGFRFAERFGEIPGLYGVFMWLVALSPFILAFVLCMGVLVRWTFGAHRPSGWLMLLAMACWGGVLLAEFFQAQQALRTWERGLQGAVEEGLEILGATLFVVAFVELLRTSKAVATQPQRRQSEPATAR